MVDEDAPPPLVHGRECGSCTLCCKVLSIKELQKPQGKWCTHCQVGIGCKIYSTRPEECRRFYCGYLTHHEVTEEWRPSKSKIVLVAELDGDRAAAHVDPGFPMAWKREPYYSDLKEWARAAVSVRGQVVVQIGKRAIIILPDEDVDLGVVADDELIVTQQRGGPFGLKLRAVKMKKDDPRATHLKGK